MFTEPDALYRLLPAYIRFRDQKIDQPLEQLLSIVGDQAAAIERDLERMYDGWFIETCDDWLIPYIGDLLGLEPAHLAVAQANLACGPELARVLSARSATANAIAHRRRKGTLWVLEEIARDIAHWPARAVEFYRQLAVASHLDHPQPSRLAVADIRAARSLVDLDGPFDGFCHLNDVRRISHAASPGRFAIPNVGVFVWRLRPYTVTKTTAYCREEAGMHCFTFSALGHDTPLFRAPVAEPRSTDIARAANLPVPITTWMLERDAPAGAGRAEADPALYGPDTSFVVETADWAGHRPPTRASADKAVSPDDVIPAEKVIPADLSDWSYKVPKGHVAVDPVRGRIAFPVSQPPRREVKVTYRYGFAMDIGGGEYPREPVPLPPDPERVEVWPDGYAAPGAPATIADAWLEWRKRNPPSADGVKETAADQATPERKALVIVLMSSGIYKGRFNLALHVNETVAVVAAPGTRPVLWLSDESPGASDAIAIRGGAGSRVILDGLLIAGRAIEVGNERIDMDDDLAQSTVAPPAQFCELWIRHSTLVPGNSLNPNCDPRRPSEPSLVIDDTSACVRIEASIVGAIRVLHDDAPREPTPISIADSIVDATGEDRAAIAGVARQLAYAALTVVRSTILGRVVVHTVRLAEDTLFVSTVEVARRQIGCMRFCFVPPGSRSPRRYECEPDGAFQQVEADVAALDPPPSPADRDALVARLKSDASARVIPRFQSVRYGTPTYARLTDCVDVRIRKGAHDQSEMGTYHDLYEPQRLSMLTDRLEEFVPASCDAAVVFVT
jgi:hypothetical protein